MKKRLCLTAFVLVLVGVLCACGSSKKESAVSPSPAVTQEPSATPSEKPGSVTEEDSRVEPAQGDNAGDVSGNNGVDSGHDSAVPSTADENHDSSRDSARNERHNSAREDSAAGDLKRAGEDLGDAARNVGDAVGDTANAVGDAAKDMTR